MPVNRLMSRTASPRAPLHPSRLDRASPSSRYDVAIKHQSNRQSSLAQYVRVRGRCRSLRRRREIPQIRRPLVLPHGHQVAVLAHEIALAADDDEIVVLAAQLSDPGWLAGPPVAP